MKTRHERFEELIETAGSQAKLARKTGIDARHIAVLRKRLRENPEASMDVDTARALTGGMSVPLSWLAAPDAEGAQEPALGIDEMERAVDPTATGRWRNLARRYVSFRRQASLAQARGATDHELDAAADALGDHHGEGPTEEESRRAILKAWKDADAYPSRTATAADFTPQRTSSPSGRARR